MPGRCLLVVAALAALPAQALFIRADRDDAEYLELATRYESSLWLEPVAAGGALIAARWILTDGASARRLGEMRPRPRLRVGENEAQVQAVFVAPDARLGLVLLAQPAKNVEPTALYRTGDESGKGVVMASFGPSGVIGEAAVRSDKRRRAAINTVDRAQGGTLELRIKAPDDASDLQGALTEGDRGSPAYIETDDGIFVTGIAAPTQPAAKVGAWNTYVRVSAAIAWVEDTMLEVAKQEMNRLLDDSGRG